MAAVSAFAKLTICKPSRAEPSLNFHLFLRCILPRISPNYASEHLKTPVNLAKFVTAATTFHGLCYVTGNNIDTDQIIPAEYLTLVPSKPDEYEKLGSYALIGLPSSFETRLIEPGEMKSKYSIFIGGENFGCGSSREHAPVALAPQVIRPWWPSRMRGFSLGIQCQQGWRRSCVKSVVLGMLLQLSLEKVRVS